MTSDRYGWLAILLLGVFLTSTPPRGGRRSSALLRVPSIVSGKIEDLELAAVDAVEFAPLPNAIIPRFWSGSDAIDKRLFSVDVNATDAGQLKEVAERVFDQYGIVLFVNTGLAGVADLGAMRRLADLVLGGDMLYEGGANNRDGVDRVDKVYEIGAPLQSTLYHHTEIAYLGTSTKALAFMSAESLPDARGATYVSDKLAVTEAILKTELGRKLVEKKVYYLREMTDANGPNADSPLIYNHWQKAFLTDDAEEAERKAHERGLEVTWVNTTDRGLLMRTRYKADAFEYFPKLDRNVMYSSLADDFLWFEDWPYISSIPRDQRPLRMTFGDGTEFSQEERLLWTKLYDDQGIQLDWKDGEVAVFCNYRFAHGRPAIHLQPGETRRLGVSLGPSFKRVGELDGKW